MEAETEPPAAADPATSEPLTAEDQAYDGDAEGQSSSAASSTQGEEAMADGADAVEAAEIDKAHPGLDVPLGEVDEAKKAADRYAKNAKKFDERGFRIMRKENASFTVGFDMFSEEEQKKREARAAKWGLEKPDDAEEEEEAKQARLEREKRAERFGVPLNDVVEKKEALKKTDLQTILSMMDKRRKSLLKLDEQDQRVDPDASVEVRPDALHLYGYMPLGTDDFMTVYKQYGATHVEWINGVSLNVVFADNYSAQRAIELTSEPLPDPDSDDEEEAAAAVPDADAAAAVEGAAEGEDAVAMSEETPDLAMFGWRLSNDIVKQKSDKYGKAGETGKLLVRYATVDDLKTYKPRPEGMEPPRKRRSSGKRRRQRDRDEMDMDMDGDGGGGGGQKLHELVIREPAEQSNRSKRRRRDNEVEMTDGDAAADEAASFQTVAADGTVIEVKTKGAKFRPGQRGRVVFNEDGSISTVCACPPVPPFLCACGARTAAARCHCGRCR
jgi:hypothetical protein